MTPLNKKLIWSALAVAMLTTPALAQRHHRPASQAPNTQLQRPVLQYPNGSLKSGSAQGAEYGAEFNLGR
jgi:hypothetical protein